MTTDPRIAPLAEALTVWQGNRYEYAADILAALPPDWCGHDPDIYNGRYTETVMVTARDAANNREIARLRKIEEAALPFGEPSMHAHDGLGLHSAEMHHLRGDYR